MFKKSAILMMMATSLVASAQDANQVDERDAEVVKEVVQLFTGSEFDLADYSIKTDEEKEKLYRQGNGLYELVEVKKNDINADNEVNFTVTLKKKWDLGLYSEIVDTKGMTPQEWRSRTLARDAYRVQVGSATYNFNDTISAGPAVLRSTNWVGSVPRSDSNPEYRSFVGGTVKIVFK